MKAKPTVVIGLLGTQLDGGQGPQRWSKWRPSVAICQHDDFVIGRFELLHDPAFTALAKTVQSDVEQVSPETQVRRHPVPISNPWDFEEVYGALHDFAHAYPWRPDDEDYLVHITTGSHVAQICLFLLAESRRLPARLLQSAPPKKGAAAGQNTIIDLDLSKYDRLASRFLVEHREGLSFLKSGIDTRNARFNTLIARIEQVASASKAPLLLTGPTGAGKSQLAKRIFELKKSRQQVAGAFVEVNCATIRGDGAMSALFGHVKGAFTGALTPRPGLLKRADGGVLFLDEIGELGSDEQAMLLRALEEKMFLPLGSDAEVRSEFQLLAGTNRKLKVQVANGAFREDLLARIEVWSFELPGLAERREDLEPNLDYELERAGRSLGARVTLSREARAAFLEFGTSSAATWSGNFRDLGSAVTRMATLAAGGRIDRALVLEETERLRESWRAVKEPDRGPDLVVEHLGAEAAEALDRFERVQLADVLRVCRESESMSAAGRVLFASSRTQKASSNDADRLRKYLARHALNWREVGSSSRGRRYD